MASKNKFLFPGREDSDESLDSELNSVESLESFSSTDSIELFFFDSGTLLVWLIVILVLDRFFNGLFGEILFDWFEFSISDFFGMTSSLVGNFNSVCTSVFLPYFRYGWLIIK